MNPWDFQNTPTYNSQGFQNSLTPQINQAYGQMNSDTNYAYAQQGQGQQNINNLQQKQQGIAQMDQYPAMSNSYGLGSQPALTSTLTQANPVSANPGISNTSQGFNPWSMIGESNAR